MARKPHVPKYPSASHSSGQARIHIGNRDVYLGVFGSPESHAEYQRVIREWLGGSVAMPSSTTAPAVAEIVARFLVHAEAHYSARGRELVQFRLSVRELLELYAKLPARDFRARHLERVRDTMAQTLCRNVTNRRMVRIRTIWRWAERQELVPAGSYEHLRTLPWLASNSGIARNTDPVRPTAWRDLLAVCRCAVPAVRTMLLLCWWSGMRSCEVRGMKNGEVVTGKNPGDPWVFQPNAHKTEHLGHQRIIMLGPKCQALLRPWLRPDDPDGFVFRPLRCRRNAAGLEQFKAGGYTFHSYRNAVRQACIRAGVRLRPHSLRHAARLRATRSHGLDAARAFLGHTSLETTNRYAAGQDVETARQVARKLG